MKRYKKESGITLIALIITIIILVILAAVSIRAVTNMKIVDYAVNGAENYAKAGKAENKTLDETVSYIDEAVAKVEEAQNGFDITKGYWKLTSYDGYTCLFKFNSDGTFYRSNGEGTYTFDGTTLNISRPGTVESYAFDGEKFVNQWEDSGETLTQTLTKETTHISFTINSVSYQAIDGMNWEMWVNSSYNKDGYKIVKVNYSSYVKSSSDLYVNNEEKSQWKTSVIQSNGSYVLGEKKEGKS